MVGVAAKSYWVSSLNGQATDTACQIVDPQGNVLTPYFLNVQNSGTRSGPAPQPFHVIAPTDRLRTFLRVGQPSYQILTRFVISDQDVTGPPQDAPCQYGTQVKSGSPLSTIITPELVVDIVARTAMSWLAIAFVPLHYTVLDTQRLCSSPPPPIPALPASGFFESIGQTAQALDAVSWPYFCECRAGATTPVPYPPPTLVQPPNWPTTPTFTCAEEDICATLVALRQEMAALRQTTSSVLQLATLTQRYGLPFAYLPGALHFGLSGEGEISIPRCVGLQVNVTSPPPARVLEGNPDYWWDQGWMSVGNDTGMFVEQRIARPVHLWQPRNLQEATRFRWSLNPGVVIDMRELYAEP